MTYRSKEVCEIVGIAPSTLRRYIQVFNEAFSTDAKRRYGRRYNDNDLSIIATIKNLFSTGFTETEVKTSLRTYIDEPTEPVDDFQPPALYKALNDKISSVHDAQINHNKRLAELEQRHANSVQAWNDYNHKNPLTRLWLRITGRAPSRPLGM